MPQFFIDRPVFAWVLALLIILAGSIAYKVLPVAAYPSVAPPQVQITATYPGANAKNVEQNVTAVMEDSLNGIEGMIYMYSTSSNNGVSTITLVFKNGYDIDIGAVDAQNRINTIESKLPQSVTQQGISIDKTQSDFLLVVALFDRNGNMETHDLGDFYNRVMDGEILRVDGVGKTQLFGSTVAMRIWLDPKRMASFNVAPSEVVAAIEAQNLQLATGEVGSLPTVPGQELTKTIIVPNQLHELEEFENIIIRHSDDGALVRIRDVADIERGAQGYSATAYINGQEGTAFAVSQSNSANALKTAEAVKAKLEELRPYFPEGMDYLIPYDTSRFIEVSMEEVMATLYEAIFLVALVMFIFLQSWRTTVIPLIVVPISLLGAAIGMSLFGFSINNLTMFGMVLAIGIVVDDAVIVVENIMRLIEEEGLSPYKATKKAMKQISGAVIGTTAVLTSVFVPMAFFGGSVGVIYRQFSLTMISSILISSFLALSLTPAMAQAILKRPKKGKKPFIFFAWFNRGFAKLTDWYMAVIHQVIKPLGIIIIVVGYFAIIGFDAYRFRETPTAFLPTEDQGFIGISSILPQGATRQRAREQTIETDRWMADQPEVTDTVSILGFSFLGSGQNASLSFGKLKDWEERKTERTADEIIADANNILNADTDQYKFTKAMNFAFNMPAIPALGNGDGFDFRLQDRGNIGQEKLRENAEKLIGLLEQTGKVINLRINMLGNAPALTIKIDRDKASAMGVELSEINNTIQVMLGSAYVNQYIEEAKVHQVWVQGTAETRAAEENIMNIQVRNRNGDLVFLRDVASTEITEVATQLNRYNAISSIPLTGNGAPGVSSGEVISLLEENMANLDPGLGYEWSGQSLQEVEAGSQATLLMILSLIIVYLSLAALYESWSIPTSVMLVVPLGVFGCFLAIMLPGFPNDVYFKVGLITIIGLSTKNAILIVEFAKEAQDEGMSLIEAVLTASRLRFRPILMTSFAFIFGVLPLVKASGAGANSRHHIGTGVMGGMISATFIAIFAIPVFYLLIRKLFPKKPTKKELEEGIVSHANTSESNV